MKAPITRAEHGGRLANTQPVYELLLHHTPIIIIVIGCCWQIIITAHYCVSYSLWLSKTIPQRNATLSTKLNFCISAYQNRKYSRSLLTLITPLTLYYHGDKARKHSSYRS